MTPQDRAALRLALGAYACDFTNEQLDLLWQAGASADSQLAAAVAGGFYQLMTGAIEYTNFRQGETQESEGVIFDRLWKLYTFWANRAGIEPAMPTVKMQQVRLQYVDTGCCGGGDVCGCGS